MLSKPKKLILTLFLACFVSISFFAASAKPASAQWVVTNPDLTALEIQKRVEKTIGATLMQTGTIALVNALNYFVQKLAYDAAVWVASGGSGQKPLFDGKSVGDYFKDTALNAAGDFIGTLSEGTLGKLRFNLCAPKLPTLFIKIKLGLASAYQAPTPKCEWNQVYSNWDTFVSSVSTGEVLKNVGFMFEGGQSELGVAFELNSIAIAKSEQVRQESIIERLNNKGWKSVTDIVTGKVTTPTDVVRESFGKSYFDHPYQQQIASFSAFTDALGRGAWQILPAALSTFTNTLLSNVLNNVLVGLFPGDLISDDNGNLLTDSSKSIAPASPAVGRRKAQEIFSDLIKPKIAVSSNYDPLIEFTACPSDETEKKINNCAIDDSFASAVRLASQGEPVTILEAIKQGYLDGSKPLISSSDSRNQKSDCYLTGYCYSNLVKLRKARILPVGFELATEIGADQANPPKLQDVISAFNNCNSSGERDTQHPYCHLLDPNWVLRLPKTQCQAQVYGQTLLSVAGPIRAGECADPIACIAEDENGNCIGGWGYCTKEKNIWRISADVCNEQFNSCLTYKPRTSENKSESYLRNTLEFNSCTAFNAGCRPYSIDQVGGSWSLYPGSAIYFNKDLEKCTVASAGCTEVYDKTQGLQYNLIKGSSFEGENFKQYWTILTGASASLVTDAFDGASAILISDISQGVKGIAPVNTIKLENNTAYAISAYAKQATIGGTSNASIGFSLFTDSSATKIFDASNIIITCNGNISAEQAFVEGSAQIFQSSISGDSYSRISCAFLTPATPLYAKIYLGIASKGEILFDAIQIEEGAVASPYLKSGYGTVIAKNIKIAPEYLDCDVDSTDPSCSGYTRSCKEEEFGCEQYTPKTGEPAVSGVASINDVCPSTCVGYETYRQEKASFEEEKFPLYFIPTSADICNANEAGCDEFTDMATESLEYFSFIRMCKKLQEADNAVFYTWEGSDTEGYQLRSHRLVTGTTFSGEVGPVPAYIEGTDPVLCNKTIFELGITDPGYTPDCREFYNQNGQISYRLLSKTIISTDDCNDYRKTESSEPDCVLSGGVWQGQTGLCIYKGYKPESASCSATAAGCRAYSGAAASNLRLVLQDDFEGGGASGFAPGVVSPEALNAGGHSLKVLPIVGQATTEKNVSTILGANSIYTLSFWAKAPAGGNMEIGMLSASEDFFNIKALKSEWQYYEVGPMRTGAQVPATSVLRFALFGGNGFYIDNIILKEASQKTYLVKNSWTTPTECDATINGLALPQAMLGCKEYTDKNNNSVYLKSFSSLCREKAVGCKSFVNTYNSAKDTNEVYNALCSRDDFDGGDCQYSGSSVCQVSKGSSVCRFKITDGVAPTLTIQQKNFNNFNDVEVYLINQAILIGAPYIAARDESTVEVSDDKTIYIIDDKTKYCNVKDLGCAEMGKPALYQTNTATAATVYNYNRPNEYDSVLCTAEAEGCESWTSDKGIDYFKVPETLCEYKEQGTVSSAGWYKKGTSDPCYSGFIQNNTYGIWRNADADYTGSVGLCPSNQNGCTEIIDPQDTSSANPNGRPYYLIDNQKLKSLENDPACSGNVSLEEGCVMFNKTSVPNLLWSAGATYFKADKEEKLVAPVTQYGNCKYTGATSGYIESYSFCFEASDCPAVAGYTASCAPASPTYDSNIVLSVTRDRECGEWLSCKTTIKATDPITNKEKPVCAEIGLCNKYSASNGNATCANFLAENSDSGWVLDANYYARRETGWYAMDYSGYSVGNQFPATDIKTQDIGTAEKEFILYVDTKKTIGSVLGAPTIVITSGQYDLDGSVLVKSVAEGTVCRGYPEQDSPFPESVAQYDINGNLIQIKSQAFQNANICEYGEDCECDYTKLTYGNATTKKYVTYGNRSVASGICQGGPKDGSPCVPGVKYEDDPKNSCGDITGGGTCLILKRQDDVIGWQGYCLERDLSTPINGDKTQKACLTWLPQDLVPGARDIYNQFRTAGYTPPLGAGKYYCLQASGKYDANGKNIENKYDNFIKLSPAITTTCLDGFGFGIPTRICGTDETFKAGSNEPFSPTAWLGIKSVSILMSDQNTAKFGLKQSFTASFTNGPINKDQIELVRIKVLDQERLDMDIGTIFYIRSNQEKINYMAGTGYCDGDKKTDNCIGEENSGGLKSQEKALSVLSGDNWYFRYDDNEEVDGTKRDYLSIDLFSIADDEINDYCGNGEEVAQDAYALKFRFKNNVLQGIDVAGCTSGAQDGNDQLHGLIFEISFRMRELCEVVVDVASSKNMADTNVTWQYNLDNNAGAEKYSGNSLYHYGFEMQPFGSAQADIAPSATQNWYSYYTIGLQKFAGVPWSCKEDCGTPKPSNNNKTDIDFDEKKLFTTISNKPNILGADTAGSALNFLSNIFGKVFKAYKWKGSGQTGYAEINCETSPTEPACALDYSNTGNKPLIYSYNPSVPINQNQYQLADPNRIVINNIASGDINVKSDQYLAIVRFYAWANSTHMPITSIKVDWEGDGKYNFGTTDGLYKNHKPICANSNTEKAKVCSGVGGSEIVCVSDNDCPGVTNLCNSSIQLFGNSPDACEEGYFELQHIYTCSEDSEFYYTTSGKCEFNPEVVVTDNWNSDNELGGAGFTKTVVLPNGSTNIQNGAYYNGKIILQPVFY